LQQLPDARLRRQALKAVIPTSMEENPRATIDLIESLGAWGSVPIATVFEAWAKADPAAALTKAAELSLSDRTKALAAIAHSWAVTDAKAALAWAEALPEGLQRENILERVIQRWADSDPKAAATYLAEITPGRLRDLTFTSTVNQWAQDDPEGVLAWSRSLRNSSVRQEAITLALSRLADFRPDNAIVAAKSLSGDDRRTALSTTGRVAAWVGTFSESSLRDELLYDVTCMWTRLDPLAAKTWVQSLPAEKSWESAIRAYAHQTQAATSRTIQKQ
jgi:hypothetical protein